MASSSNPSVSDIEVQLRQTNLVDVANPPEVVFLSDDALIAGIDLWRNCLLGKIFSTEIMTFSEVSKAANNVWWRLKPIDVKRKADNLYSFRFNSAADLQYVLTRSPWCFDGYLIILTEWNPTINPLEVNFLR
ncbi:protein of unknown function DUF4283 [Macleaya cordata]|uniref:DUF4283 domain-containing protein n=1 Tax=Macleaya cordata TaxID=56857 RepID=A0A200Q7C9_MACCD|nr:protein of unknown function DUF4283 [Macleaya cordata]